MDNHLLDDDERREYVKRVGKGGIQLLVEIDKLRPIVDFWLHHELGKTILDYSIEKHVTLLNKAFDSIIETGKADQEDLIAVKQHYGFLKFIGTKVNNYDEMIAKGKGVDASKPARTKKRARHGSKKV